MALVRQMFVHPPDDQAIDVELPQDAHKVRRGLQFMQILRRPIVRRRL